MNRQSRQFTIKEIISSLPIANQEELRRELRQRGFRVTQATLSRDLKDLGVSRVAMGEGIQYVIQPAAEAKLLQPLIGAEVLSIEANESVIVIRTLPGCASVVAEFIDIRKNSDIIGTLAGDNTLLIIPRSTRKTQQIMQLLKHQLIEGTP